MKSHLLRLTLAPALALASAVVLPAADRTWDGGAGNPNWSAPANWGGDTTAPANGDNLIFSGFTQQVNNNDLAALAPGWLRFDYGDFVLTGNALTLSAGFVNVSGSNTVIFPLTLGAAQTFESQSGVLALQGTIANGGYTLTFDGSGETISTNAISGTGAVVKQGGGTVTFTGAAAAANTFTGGLTVNGGIVVCNKANGSTYGGSGNGNVVVKNGATLRASGDNSLVGQTTSGSKVIQINAGGTVDNTGTTSCHLNHVALNGGTLTATTPNGTWGNWNLDYGVSTLGGGTFSYIGAYLGGGGNVTLGQTGGTVFNIAAGDTVTVNSVIARTTSATDLGLIKTGPGTLVLAADNTYASPTTISNGLLQITSPNALLASPTVMVRAGGVLDVGWSGFSVSANQTLGGSGAVTGYVWDNNPASYLAPGGNNAAGTLGMEYLNLGGNLTLNFDLANVTTVGTGVNDLLIVTNFNLSAFATNAVNFNFLNGTPAVGTYTIIQYASGPPAGPVTTLSASASRYSYTFSSDGSSIKVTVAGTPAPLVWRGDGATNAWDVGATSNWMNGVVRDAFLQGDNATFNDTGSNTPPVNLLAGVQPTIVTVNATKDYALAGAGRITGGARLVKSGSGTLTVSTENDFTGGTVVHAGTLAIGAGGATGNLAGGNGTNNARIVINRTGTMTSGANLAGTGSLALVNNGTVNLTGTNTYTGGTLVNFGSLQIGNNPPVAGASIAGSITNYANVYFGRSDAFTLQSPITSAGNSFLNGPGILFLRTTAGMSVDGTAGIDLAGNIEVSRDVFGRLIVNPGANINLGGELLVGNPGGVSGEVIQNGGVINIGNRVRLAHWNNHVSYYTMNGGLLNVANALNVGWDGIGLFTLNDGTVNCLSLAVDGNGNTGVVGGTNEMFSIYGGRINIGQGGITTASSDGGYRVLLGGGVIGARANWSSSLAMLLTNGPGVTFDTAENTITLTGVLSGTNGLTKQGTGYLNLNTAGNTFSGPVSVAQGTLQGSGTVSGPVTVQSGAALSAGTTAATGTLTISNHANFSSGARLVIDASTTAATSDRVDVRGTLTLDAAGTPAWFNFLGGQPFTGGAYTVISNLLPRSGSLTVVNPSRYTATVDESNPSRIQVSFTGTNATLVWKGNVNNAWDLNTTANWFAGGAASTYYQSDAVLFDSAGLTRPNVSLAAEMAPASVTVNAGGDYTFSGAGLAGLGALTKSGSGKLILANDNPSFLGTVSVGAGTLQIGNGGTTGSLPGNIANNSAVVFNRADAVTYPGGMSGAGTLTQAGAGKLTLAANNTFTGGTIINPGTTLQIGAGLNAGTAGSGPINVQAGGSLIFFRNDGPAVANPISGGGAITFKGTGATGAGGSQGSFTLTATNTFSGTVTLDQVRLSPGNALALGTLGSFVVPVNSTLWPNVAGAVFTPSLNLSGAGWPEAGGYLGALRLGSGATWAGPITLSGNTRLSSMTDANDNRITGVISGAGFEADFGAPGGGAGVLTLAPGAPNTFGALRISPGILIAGNANALPASVPLSMNGGTLRLNGNSLTATSFLSPANGIIQNGSSNQPCTLTLNVNDPVTYGGTFADFGAAPLALVKNGGGVLTLTAINTALGGVTVNGGVLALNNGGGNGTVKGTLTANPGTLILSLNNDSLGYNAGNNQVTNLVLHGASLIHAPNNNLTLWQNLVVNLTGGYLAATNAGGAARLDFGTGASLLTQPSANPSVIFTTGSAGTASGLYLRQANTVFTVADGAATDDLLINAPINQAANGYGLTKNGAGRMYLAGPISFSGALTINGGSVVLGPNASLGTVAGDITIGSGATLNIAGSLTPTLTLQGSQVLTGAGTLVGGLTDGAGSIIRPGASAGTLTLNGDLNLGGYGSLDFELANVTTVGGGVNDLIQVNGNVVLNDFAPTVVNFTFLNGAHAAGAYTLIKYTGTLSGTVPAGITNAAGVRATFTHVPASKEIRVTFSQPAQSLVWEGDGGMNAWDLTDYSTVWHNGAVNTNFYQADSVRFDDTRTTVNTTVSVTDVVKPAAITVDSAYDYTLTGGGRIGGATGLTKNNTGTLTLATANDFTGPINVNAGLLKAGIGGALSTGTRITIADGAGFDYAGFGSGGLRGYQFFIAGSGPDGNGALQNSGAAIYENASVSNLTLTAAATIGGVNRWDIGTAANQAGTFLQGSGFPLTKVGANEITLRTESVSKIGGLFINEGTVKHEAFSRTNVATTTITNIVNPGGILSSYGALTLNYPVVFAGGALDNQNSTATWIGPMKLAAETPATVNNPINLLGRLYDTGPLVKLGTGVLTISNANTYTGGTVLSNGPVNVNGNGAAGAAALIVSHPGALGTGTLTLSGGAITANTLTNTFRAVEFNVRQGGIVPNDIVLPLEMVGNIALQGRDATSVLTLAGRITGGHAGLTNWLDNGAGNVGVLRLSNPANDFTVGSLRLLRGTLALTTDALGHAANTLTILTNATLRFDAPGVTLAHGIFTGPNAQNIVILDLYGDNDGNGVRDTVNDATISGVLSGAGTVYPRGTNGTLVLSGNNALSSGFELQQPVTLQVAASANLGTAYVALKGNSTFRYTGAGAETMTRTFWNNDATLGGGTIDIPNASATLTWNPGAGTFNQWLTKTGAGTLIWGTQGIGGGLLTVNAGAMTVNSVISGASIVRVNAGTLTLAGANTYTGGTFVNGGTLFVNGATALASGVTVAPGGTLGGTGTINGPTTVQAGGVLSPGVNAIGRLTVANALNLAGTTLMEINKATATNDSVVSVTSIVYGGTLTVNNLADTLAAGDTFKLFTAWSYTGGFSTINLPPLDAGLVWDTTNLLVDGTIKVSSVAPPALAGGARLPDGNFQLTLSGTVGQGYKILASSDVAAPLPAWTVLETGALPTAAYLYNDLTATNFALRFYLISTP